MLSFKNKFLISRYVNRFLFKNHLTSNAIETVNNFEQSKNDQLNEFLINYARKHPTKTTFSKLFNQLDSNANRQLPFILPYEHIGRKSLTKTSDLLDGIVTIAHILPSTSQVILASGFAIHDGGLIVTCAHTFYQAARHLHSNGSNSKSQSILITHEGELIGIAAVESHLVISDLVLLKLNRQRKLTALPIDPYPAPVSTALLSYNFSTASLSSTSLPSISHSWTSARVLFYKNRCGQEAQTGTYDELSSMMYSHAPSNGSSGGPILNAQTHSVVGIVRGSELNYTNRKCVGFAIPSEGLFEAFKLPGMPDGL